MTFINFQIQWHITEKCPNQCKHCYMFDEEYKRRIENEKNYMELRVILDKLKEFEEKYNIFFPRIVLTGGDPMAHSDCMRLIQEIKARGKDCMLLGIPERVTDEMIIELMQKGVSRYQVSLDGLEKTHDNIRGKGSFKKTISALCRLSKSGIQTTCMFTLHPQNCSDLFPLIEYLEMQDININFAFDFFIPIGNGRKIEGVFEKEEVEKILTEYGKKKKELEEKGAKLHLREKPSLYRTYNMKLGNVYYDGNEINDGCSCGVSGITILPNGDVLPCRRLPICVGNLYNQTFEEIFLGNDLLKKMRRSTSYELCCDCRYRSVCRGCPGHTYAMTGEVFGEYSYCYLKERREGMADCPGIETSYFEEFEFWMKARFNNMDNFGNIPFKQVFDRYGKDIKCIFDNL